MIIRMQSVVMTDGSVGHDAVIEDHGDRIVIPCADERAAAVLVGELLDLITVKSEALPTFGKRIHTRH